MAEALTFDFGKIRRSGTDLILDVRLPRPEKPGPG
jgi:hypothetical protein